MHLPKIFNDLTAFLKAYNVPLQLIFIPLAAGNLPAYFQSTEASCGFVLIVMSIFWITECLPFAITSILPVIFFPLFGIMKSEKVSSIYFQDILMLFLGGLVLATTVEESDLHKRVAFKVIKIFGTNPLFLLLGMMFVTWFLSLWISNTATTAMMLPIVVAMCEEISELLFTQPKILKELNVETVEIPHEIDVIFSHNEPYHTDPLKPLPAQRLLKGFMIGISYSAIIGGCGSLVGTSTNLILKGYYGQTYPHSKLNFFTYMMYALPVAFIMLIFTWIILCIIWLPRELLTCKHKTDLQKKKNLKAFIHNEYLKLGPINWEQISIGCIFLLLVILWISRDLIFMPGWGYFFKEKYVTDTTPAIFILLLLTTWPKNNIFRGLPYEPLITWKKINDTFPWNILLLAGGGLALAEGFKESGLSILIGDLFDSSLPKTKELELLIIVIVTQIGTELISNNSMVAIFLPIANALALKNDLNPNYLLIPLTLSSSFSFMLPVSTPPNTIIFSTGFLKIRDLAISGFILKLLGTGVLFLSTLWIEAVLGDPRDLHTTNSTISTTARTFYAKILTQNDTLF